MGVTVRAGLFEFGEVGSFFFFFFSFSVDGKVSLKRGVVQRICNECME